MARVVATAALMILLFSLLAVANCRVLEAEPDTDGASLAVAVPDEQRTPNPVVSGEADTAEVIPATVAVGEGFLRLPSHKRSRRPCRHGQGLFHQHLWWARHHGLPHGHGDARVHNLAVVSTELEKENEVQAVAEPDPDSHPDTDGEHEVEEETMKPFHGEEAEDDDELTKAWKEEMLRRFRHGLRFHHRHHLQHHHHDEEDDTEHNKEGAGAVKRLFHFHHHDGEEKMTSKRFHRDSDRGDEEQGEEEMAKQWRKAIKRGRFHQGRRHHHAEEAEKEGGVMKWFLDLMNRF